MNEPNQLIQTESYHIMIVYWELKFYENRKPISQIPFKSTFEEIIQMKYSHSRLIALRFSRVIIA